MDSGVVELERAEGIADVSNGNGIIKMQIDDRAAGKIDAEIEAAHGERGEAASDENKRNGEPNFGAGSDIKHGDSPPSKK